MSRQTLLSRAFDPVTLTKLGFATAIAGGYYLINGPFVSFDKSAYGFRGLLAKTGFMKLPAGINGFPSEVSDDLRKLIEATKAEINMPDEVKERIEFRTAPIAFPAQYGSGRLHKAYAALPDYVNVSRITELRANCLNNYLQHLYKWQCTDAQLWLSPVGKLLIDSFVLSDRAKKFLIARQAFMADNDMVFTFAPLFFLFTYIFYLSSDIIEKKTRHSPAGFKISLIGGIFALTFLNYFLLLSMMIQKMHGDADAKAITRGAFSKSQMDEALEKGEKLPIDPEYYEGAIEFYTKEMQRNRAMRLLIKKTSEAWLSDGSSQFTEDGDFRSGSLSMEPFPSRAIRNIIGWKLGNKSSDQKLFG